LVIIGPWLIKYSISNAIVIFTCACFILFRDVAHLTVTNNLGVGNRNGQFCYVGRSICTTSTGSLRSRSQKYYKYQAESDINVISLGLLYSIMLGVCRDLTVHFFVVTGFTKGSKMTETFETVGATMTQNVTLEYSSFYVISCRIMAYEYLEVFKRDSVGFTYGVQ
jgi:hypothetical protein